MSLFHDSVAICALVVIGGLEKVTFAVLQYIVLPLFFKILYSVYYSLLLPLSCPKLVSKLVSNFCACCFSKSLNTFI